MSDSLSITLHTSAEETVSGSGTAIDLYGDDSVELRRFVRLQLIVSAITAATLDVVIETSADGVTWSQVASFDSVTATGRWDLLGGDCQRYVRARWTITGTSATFEVAGTGEPTYCSLADLGHASILPSSVTDATKIRYLLEATDDARGRILQRATPPILQVGSTIRRAVAKMATTALMVEEIGLNPQSQAHVALFTERDRAVARLKDMAAGRAAADFTDSTPTVSEGVGSVVTGTSRDWDIGIR